MGVGSSNHLMMELVKSMSGTDFVHVPGPVDLYLTTEGDDTIEIASKESGANAPALIVHWTP